MLTLVSTLVHASTTPIAPAPMSKAYGIYCLPAGEMPGQVVDVTAKYSATMWTSNYYTGVALRNTWSMVQPSSGTTYDWTLFDNGLTEAQANNKQISLSVAAGGFCPSWLINKGAKYQTVTVQTSFETSPTVMQMVYPWDPVFQSNWSALVSAMGARYDGDANVGYVYIGGTGNYIESFVVQSQSDYNTFAANGGLTSWTSGCEAIIDMYGAAFKNTPFVMAVGNPCGSLVTEQAAGATAAQNVINYGLSKYPGRFGVVNQGLCSTTDSLLTYMGANYFLNVAIADNSATTAVGFQTLTSASSNRSTYTLGTLSGALAAGINLGGHFIEVYKTDCLNSANESLIQTDDALLKLN